MKFGTSGLRGLVSDMTDPVCAAYVTAFLDHLAQEKIAVSQVLVGQDLRPSSARIAAACRAAIRAAGIASVDCGVVPTPALALESAARGAPAIMVTGSHIPFDRNGLKFYRPDGEITKHDEIGILEALEAPAAARPAPGADLEADVAAPYLARTTSFFGPDCLAGKRIGVYQHSAAGRDLLVTALRELGAEPVELGRTDEFVPVDTEAIAPSDAVRIAVWVKENALDALVSTDGDGDRPLIADETGMVFRGDMVGMLTAKFLGADAVATPVSSSSALERTGWFARVARTRIGSPFVIDALEQLNAQGATLPVGYEANGGFLLAGTAHAPHGATLPALPTRDALAPLLTLLVAAATAGEPLSALAAMCPPRVTASSLLREVSPPTVAALLEKLTLDAAARQDLLTGVSSGAVSDVDTLDGVRMTLDSGDILHLRMSGNAPELRGYAEAETTEQAEALVASLLDRVEPMVR